MTKPIRVRPQHAPTATLTVPDGRQIVCCLDCSDELHTRYAPLARHFRDWHLVQHLHVEAERDGGGS